MHQWGAHLKHSAKIPDGKTTAFPRKTVRIVSTHRPLWDRSAGYPPIVEPFRWFSSRKSGFGGLGSPRKAGETAMSIEKGSQLELEERLIECLQPQLNG